MTMRDFIYTSDYSKYKEILRTPITKCICKHVMNLDGEKAQQVFTASNKVGYNKCLWGYGSKIYENEEENRLIQLNTITRMIYKGFIRPFRVVIDEAGVPWVDNLHSAIRDILIYGEGVTLGECRLYIVDARTTPYTVVDINNTVNKDLYDINGMLQTSEDRINRICSELRDINYTIEEFMDENNINIESMKIDKDWIVECKKKRQECG